MWNPRVTRDISSFIISESLGAVWDTNPRARYSTSLIFLLSLGLFELSNTWVSRNSSSLIISESLGLFGLSNPCVSPYSTSLIISGFLGLSNPCVSRDWSSLIISETVGAFWDVVSMADP
jgi:hypothetical protein